MSCVQQSQCVQEKVVQCDELHAALAGSAARGRAASDNVDTKHASTNALHAVYTDTDA